MPKATKTFAIGDKVRLTAKFLRNTGQYTGSEPFARWTITGFSNGWAIVDEPLCARTLEMFTEQELAEDPTLRFRRVATANLQHVR